MNDDHALNLVYLLIFLVMVLSALSVRRIPLGFVVRSAAAWAVIIAIVYLGVSYRYDLSDGFAQIAGKLGLAEQSVAGDTVRIRMASDGHFWAHVRINGVARRMLIDSGATMTALSQETAAAAGIVTAGGELPVLVQTANGTISAKRVRIARVALGPLAANDVGAIVSPAFGEVDVLGMNFLSRLRSWRVEQDTLILEPVGSVGTTAHAGSGGEAKIA